MGDREWLDLLRGGLKELTDLDYRPVRGVILSSPLSSQPPQTVLLDLMVTLGTQLAWLFFWPVGMSFVGMSFMGFHLSPSCLGRVCFSFAPQKKDSKFCYSVPASTVDIVWAVGRGCGQGPSSGQW